MRKSPAKAKSEDSPAYISAPSHAALPSHADALRALEDMPTAWVVSYALDRVQADIPTAGPMMGGPAAVREYLVLKNASHADQMVERFSVLFLDSQLRAVLHGQTIVGIAAGQGADAAQLNGLGAAGVAAAAVIALAAAGHQAERHHSG